MELAQVFANNIQISQLKAVIPQYEWNESGFKKERNYFLWWLLQPELGGRYTFSDQLSAWEAYSRTQEVMEFGENELEPELSWMDELEIKLENSVRMSNYTEFGGQQ